ncbi:MAG TPA: dTDP-4-dehydrorhamnose 3,5-epimerase [Alphaproteobacteria bacterium]|nr:dTDP-4-dehydrorhamnose 3,5-epimerase [Alphaproteobacteria bacterium]HNS43798.1 dTDP-4-dehydrorhamnose 3,5-epimerase [Alphaproteobacteria bacterium]
MTPFDIDGPLLVSYPRFEDARGMFAEVFNAADFKAAGIDCDFVQDNISMTLRRGTIRGLHFQIPPFAQDKLVRIHRGRIFDVVVDLRTGRNVCCEIAAEDDRMLFVPKGFAHGFCALEDNTEVFYKVSAPYNKEHDAGILWNDPDLAIEWPVGVRDILLSDKDRNLPRFKDLPQGLF